MRPAGCEAEVIRALASMPFLDRTEMVAVTGRSKGAVYEAVERLEQGGFCTAVPHAASLFPQTQRYHLAAAGLHWLAGEEGKSLDDLMLERPLSAQWRRNLMERLDALASIYRLAAALAALEYPIRFRWYRALPLDAAVELPGGRSVGIVRRGNTADRSPFSNRMWRLRGRPLPGAVLVLMPDPVRLRHSRRMLDGFPAPVFLAVEGEAVAAAPATRSGLPPPSAPASTCAPSSPAWKREARFPRKARPSGSPSPRTSASRARDGTSPTTCCLPPSRPPRSAPSNWSPTGPGSPSRTWPG